MMSRLFSSLIVVAALSACGDSTQQQPTLAGSLSGTKATMPISYSDAPQLARTAASMPTNSMAFNVVQMINAANAGLSAFACGGGVVHVHHIDADADAEVSANDSVLAQFEGCGREQLNGSVDIVVTSASEAFMSIKVTSDLRSAAQKDISSTLLGVVEEENGHLVAVFNGQVNTQAPGEDAVNARELNLELSHDGIQYSMGFDYVLSIDGPAGADTMLVDTTSELTSGAAHHIEAGEIRILGLESSALVSFDELGAELAVDYDADGINDLYEQYGGSELAEGMGH